MPSFVRHTASGSTDTFSVPFPYLNRNHVQVRLDGGSPLSTGAYTWPTPSTIKITAGNPAAGVVVELRRNTPTAPLYSYTWGNINPTNLNKSFLQTLYVAEEGKDAADDARFRAWLTPGFGEGGRISGSTAGRVAVYTGSKAIAGSAVLSEDYIVDIRDDLNAEALARITADNNLQGLINDEAAARLAGDQTLRALFENGKPSIAPDFDTLQLAAATKIDTGRSIIRTGGYYSPGDNGDGIYTRVGAEPSHPLKFQSADGGWWSLVVGIEVRAEQAGCRRTRTGNDSVLMQGVIDMLSNRSAPLQGGVLKLSAGIYMASGLVLRPRVRIEGVGPGASVIEAPSGTNQNVLTVPLGCSMAGWSGLTIDGNAAGNTSGHGIYFEPTGNNQGQSFSPFNGKPRQDEYSYKMISATNFIVGYCRGDGIQLNGYCFDVRLIDFRTAHNLGHGIQTNCTDCLLGYFYAEKNGLCGVYGPLSGANKYISGKAIFNGRQANTIGEVAGVLIMGQANQLYAIEAQDNYCDGFYLGGVDSIFMLDANRNGYSAFGAEATSSRIHANYRFDASLRRAIFKGTCFDYASSPGTGGFWTTEYPYWIISGADFSSFECKYEPGVFNSAPNVARSMLANSALLSLGAFSTDGLATFFDLSPLAATPGQNTTFRVWRETVAGGTHVVNYYVPGTGVVRHAISSNGNVTFCADDVGNLAAGNSATGGRWNTGHTQLGPFHLWVDASNRLRIKNGPPASDTDGTVVGTQT